jgi:hypothetical protein
MIEVLGAEQTVLAGVRVEPAHRDPGRRHEPLKRGVGERHDVEYPIAVTRSIASRSEQCVLTWVTARSPFVSIIVTELAPHSPAISSVCPTNVGSVSCVASLFIGIVTRPDHLAGERVERCPLHIGTRCLTARGVEHSRTMVGGGHHPEIDHVEHTRPHIGDLGDLGDRHVDTE